MVDTSKRTPGERRATVSSSVLRLSPYLALGVALALFLILSLYQLNLPGLYYDEALDLVPMLQVMHHEPVNLLRGVGLRIGNYSYPVMLLDYMGSLNGYLTLPFMAILGPGVLAARLEPIVFSAITIILAYALARAWYGRAAGMVTALLLAVNPSFIWFSRQGISVTSVMTVFSLGSLLLVERWRFVIGNWLLVISNSHEPSRLTSDHLPITNYQLLITNYPLLLAGLLIGLGLWAKLLFLWWIVVLGVIALVWVTLSQWHSLAQNTNGGFLAPIAANLKHALRALPWVVIGVIMGAAPLIYYNLYDLLRQPFDLSNAHTLGLLFKSLSQPTDYGVNNLDFITNLGKAIADFNVFVDGSYFWYISGIPYSNIYAMPTLVVCAVVGSALAFERAEWRKWLALLAAIAMTVFISAFTVSGFWATHYFIILPLPQMVIAVAVVWLAERLGRRAEEEKRRRGAEERRRSPLLLFSSSPFLLLFVGLLLALPVARDLWVSEQHHAKLAETGGSGRFSDAVYKLAAHLEEQRIFAPIALDWGIEKSVRVLTADRVRPEEIFGFTSAPDEVFNQRVRELLRDPGRQYIVLWDRFAVYNRRQAFTQIANQMGMQVTETFIAHERSGLPVYVMLQAK